ncbi:hypothetical protein DdX_03845 [Ditylenchus destructor]|uniref:Uncharacterized protein n=1 Tax=Ditylenchus destructor TaxID=166010 RepID=A0AAD4NAT9_9BILA|nr:hypothetical protein DdX_03845 [Ditylenchus destructor]
MTMGPTSMLDRCNHRVGRSKQHNSSGSKMDFRPTSFLFLLPTSPCQQDFASPQQVCELLEKCPTNTSFVTHKNYDDGAAEQ